MPFCTKCGSQLGDGAAFCRTCGQPTASAAAVPPPATANASAPAQVAAPTAGGTRRAPWIIAGVGVVVVALVAVGLFVFLRQSPQAPVRTAKKPAERSNLTPKVDVVERTVRIGVGVPLTQGAASLGQGIERAVEVAVAEANKSQEARDLGLTFEVATKDDMGDPQTGTTVANEFAADEAVIGVVGHLNSGVTIPASSIYARENIAMITPAATNPALTEQGLSNVFRMIAPDDRQGPAAAEYAYETLGAKTAVVVDDSTTYGETLGDAFASAFKRAGGRVVLTKGTSDMDTNFRSLARKIKAKKPDVVYYGGLYLSGAAFSQQVHDAGVRVPVLGGDGLFDASYIQMGGVDGDLCTCSGYPLEKLPGLTDFEAAYRDLYPGTEIAAFDAYAFDAANVIIQAALKISAEKGNDALTTSEGRQAIVDQIANTRITGATGPIGFDAKGETTNPIETIYRVEGGDWVFQEAIKANR